MSLFSSSLEVVKCIAATTLDLAWLSASVDVVKFGREYPIGPGILIVKVGLLELVWQLLVAGLVSWMVFEFFLFTKVNIGEGLGTGAKGLLLELRLFWLFSLVGCWEIWCAVFGWFFCVGVLRILLISMSSVSVLLFSSSEESSWLESCD